MSAGRRCHYCHRPNPTTRDHVIPRSRGGPDEAWNLVPACSRCNLRKADRTYEEFTGKPRLPRQCVEAGFPTTENFLRRHRIAQGAIIADRPIAVPTRDRLSTDYRSHPAFVADMRPGARRPKGGW